MKNTCASEKRGHLETRMTKMLLLIVTAAFMVMFVYLLNDTFNRYVDQEINNQKSQVSSTAQQLSYLQATLENISNLIVYNDVVQMQVTSQTGDSGSELYQSRNVNDTLKEYLHIVNGTEEIMIYTNTGKMYTTRYVRGTFNPEDNPWYMDFLESGKNSGFSSVHKSVPMQSGYQTDVISYITNYYSIQNAGQMMGKLVINFDTEYLKKMIGIDSKMLRGFWLYNSNGDLLVSDGNMEYSLAQIRENVVDGIYRSKRGDIFIVSENMNDNWTLISEISSTELMKNSFRSIAIYIFIFLFVWLILIVFLRLFIRRIVQPINQLSIAAEKVGQGSFDMSVDIHTNDEIEELADTFNKMVIDINTLMKDSVEHEKKIQNMKTENLMLQINPHFIYNTMNSIVYMARMKGNPEIADYTNAFISLLQSTLSVRDSIFNTVKNELATVENYLYLQEYRYRNKFTYHITCDPALLDCQILNVMLQPSVENAIFHGIAPKEGEGKIDITIMKQDSLLHIEIEDNGVGMSAETLESILDASSLPSGGIHKIGIGNVKQRIHEVYGDDPFGLWIESSLGEGTKVRMTIPYKI